MCQATAAALSLGHARRSKPAGLGSGAPARGVRRPTFSGAHVKQCGDRGSEVYAQHLPRSFIATIVEMRLQRKLPKAAPVAPKHLDQQTRKLVRQFATHVGSEEGLTAPKRLNRLSI
jgi:hypothetical protein